MWRNFLKAFPPCISEFADKTNFLFERELTWVREKEWILQHLNMLVSISLQVIMEAVKWLSTLTALNLTERLKVLKRLLCWIFCYFGAREETLPHFVSWQGARIDVHWRLIRFQCGLKKVKCGNPSNLLWIYS